jgi:hypothetical protein
VIQPVGRTAATTATRLPARSSPSAEGLLRGSGDFHGPIERRMLLLLDDLRPHRAEHPEKLILFRFPDFERVE